MNTNISKIVDEWSYRLSLIEGHDGLPDIESYSDLTVLKSVLTDYKWPVEFTYELLYNMEHPESKLITEEPFSYTILSNPGKGKPKPYQTMWLDTIEDGEEFELEPNGTAIIDKKILDSKGDNPDGLTFKELLTNKGTKQDWNDWFKTNTNKIIPTNQGLLSLKQISKSTYTGKAAGGGGKVPAAYYEQGICMAHAMNNKGYTDRDKAYKDTLVDKAKYEKYQAQVEDADGAGNDIVSNSGVKTLPLLLHTGKGGLSGIHSNAIGYVNDTPKTDIMGKGKKLRYSLKKEGGAQLMSGFKGDTLGVFNAAKTFWSEKSPKTAAQVLDGIIAKIEDKTSGFTDDAIVGDQEVGAIKEKFRDFYLEERRPAVKKDAEKVLKKLEKKKKPDIALIKQLTGSTVPKKKPLQDVAVDKHIKAEAGALGLISRADNPDWIIPGVKKVSPGTTSKYFKDFLNTYSDKTLKVEAQNVLEKSIDHKVLEKDIDVAWANKDFKKWAVYEAATGNFKFSGDTDENSSQTGMANWMFKFDVKGSAPDIYEMTPTWAGTYASKVKSTVGYKSTGRSKSSSWRLLTSGYEPEDVSYDGTIVKYKLNEIINEELPKLTGKVNLLVEEYISDMELLTEGFGDWIKKAGKKVYSSLKKMAKKLFEKIKSVVLDFYNKVFKKLVENLKSIAKKGFDIFMDSLGIEINGDIDYNSINIKL
jgi:hypothetical protein